MLYRANLSEQFAVLSSSVPTPTLSSPTRLPDMVRKFYLLVAADVVHNS